MLFRSAELIEKLKEYPQDLRVVVRGYEPSFVNDAVMLKKLDILPDYCEGTYRRVYCWGPENVKALEIRGRE